jgi:micrococcal nuclease
MTRLALPKRGGRRSLGQRVRVIIDPTQDRTDRYSQLFAYVDRRSDDMDLGRAMIRAGWAMAYVCDSWPFERLDPYCDAQTRALNLDRALGVGKWLRAR